MLSTILHRSSNIHYNQRFIEYHHNGTIHGTKNITYKDGYELKKRHQNWINDVITQSLLPNQGNDDQDVEIVVAYLSQNSPDLLLSILGCIDLKSTLLDSRICGYKTTIRLAMLNTRWSAKEIAQALSLKVMTNYKIHISIIIHGESMLQIAEDACSIMNSISMSNKRHYDQTILHSLPLMAVNPEVTISSNHNHKIASEPKQNEQTTLDVQSEAIILFTSGTTSGPKGVILSHLAMFIQAMAKTQYPCNYDHSTKMIATTVPYFHVGGINSALAVMMVGGCLVFPSQEKHKVSFDPKLVLQSLKVQTTSTCCNDKNNVTSGVNTLVVVPAMVHSLLQEWKDTEKVIYQGVRLILVGGQSLSQDQIKHLQIIFPNARVVQTFACTEAGSSIAFATIVDPGQKLDVDAKIKLNKRLDFQRNGTYVGRSPSHVDLAIFSLKDNRPTLKLAKPYAIGAIGTQGPHVMNGYWKRGSNAKSIGIVNQWLITNDLGYLDSNGNLYFCGRLNDVIRTGGETVFAPEVEATILQHPDVDHCAVFGIPDERFGECVCAAVVMKKKQTQEDINVIKSIRSFCIHQKLSGYKRPKKVYILDDLPRNSSGKILKNTLKKKFNLQSKL